MPAPCPGRLQPATRGAHPAGAGSRLRTKGPERPNHPGEGHGANRLAGPCPAGEKPDKSRRPRCQRPLKAGLWPGGRAKAFRSADAKERMQAETSPETDTPQPSCPKAHQEKARLAPGPRPCCLKRRATPAGKAVKTARTKGLLQPHQGAAGTPANTNQLQRRQPTRNRMNPCAPGSSGKVSPNRQALVLRSWGKVTGTRSPTCMGRKVSNLRETAPCDGKGCASFCCSRWHGSGP